MKQSVCFVLILVLCLALSFSGVLVGDPAARAAGTGTWTQLSLYGGNIGCLAIDPLTPTTLYASTIGGVYRSTDSGATWTAVNTAPAPLDVSSLVINPLTPTTLYAVTGSGVFRSVNSGTTWTAVN
ncbi:WD40/YVTN/BNR-like repeat-containing protein, partial [Candidatus Cryosericum septentrionale]